MQTSNKEYDYVVIGSGFGGSVSALRLSEKGYKVLVIEKGKWYRGEDFPKTNLNLKRWLWLPMLRFFGIFKLTFLRHVGILSGVGVGGGSLVYANTLPMPKPAFFRSGSWASLGDWEEELLPHYEQARNMLGVAKNPKRGASDEAMATLAKEINRESFFEPTEVAVYFGEPNKEVEDPYFDGKGPARSGCTFCGACMTGCRYNAKNTLDKNYLYLALQLGCEVMAEKEVVDVRQIGKGPDVGYEVVHRDSTRILKRKKITRAKGVIFSGGVLGTVKLLHKLRRTSLQNLSAKVGMDIRTNNESLIGVPSLQKTPDYSEGIAIGSILHTDEDSHLEPVRYGKGSTFWRFFMLPITKGKYIPVRILHLIGNILKSPIRHLRIMTMWNFSTKTPILLFMQHLDSTLQFKPGLFGLKSQLQTGTAPSSNNKSARVLANKFARIVDGEPYVTLPESLLGTPTTAHILGGAVMGESSETGVIDKFNKVFGYENMYICDGSMISANPGVNPSLTITAISERAMSHIKPKAEG